VIDSPNGPEKEIDLIMSNELDWLLESDAEEPGVRYFALVELADCPLDDPQVIAARQELMEQGPVPAILEAQDPAGYWVKPGNGYSPKYRGSVWSIIHLAQLGADPADARVRAGGEYLLTSARATNGAFTATGTPVGSVLCLAGNLGAALQDLGFGGDDRLTHVLDLMARYVTGQGIAPVDEVTASLRYYKSGTCGPGFHCAANNQLRCAWGAIKVLRALARVPEEVRTPVMQSALETAVDFLFSVDPATAAYPTGYTDKPSRSWFKFGFPLFYVSDVLQTAEALTKAGYGGDPRLAATYDLILSKRDKSGRWKMEYSAYQGKTWAHIEQRGRPSKWVTLRAMRVLKGGGIEV
jgi:hypothetical protein